MLHEIDAVLRALLTDALPKGVSVDFATPHASWADGVAAVPTVSVFLGQVREDIQAREANWTEIRDEHGRVVGRQPPPRQYRVSYLLTAWDADVESEHELLGTALGALIGCDVVPAGRLVGSLAAAGQPVTIDVGHPRLPGSASDVWEALGIRPRAHLDVVVTVVSVPAPLTDLAAPAETLDLGIGEPAVTPARQTPKTWAGKRVRERI